ncbi:response regulator receiver protein [Taibaiella soli]|uniref:Response regulator receiver protein n=1 Tax=Taibaiella soli TaxID=1649169 RepID=A0A2W2ARZ6_9BACT|nr:response regulator receiver protein [Taibaiella soli]PZF70754.1 response regulator receiver protein [Taibaiella soli]
MNDESSLKILAVGYHEEIMKVLKRLINSHSGWTGTIALSILDAQQLLKNEPFDAILLCAGVSQAEEQTLVSTVNQLNAQIKIIRHYGGGSGLLENEIRAAFS